jgi:hypothetical protein
MGIRSFARSLRPGNDRELANELSQQRRRNHRRNIRKTAAQGEQWEQQDRADERRRRGPYTR